MEEKTIEIVECNAYQDAHLQQCFRDYFCELGEPLRENTSVFDQMQRAATDCGMRCLVIQRDADLLGFILFQEEVLTHQMAFFTERLGFIRELWVNPCIRKMGYGKALVLAAQTFLKDRGVRKMILTYEQSALDFYERLGYQIDPSYCAANEQGGVTRLI